MVYLIAIALLAMGAVEGSGRRGSVRRIDAARPAAPDAAGIARRTRVLQEALNAANASSPLSIQNVRPVLDTAQHELPVPHGLERLRLPRTAKETVRQEIDSLRLRVLADASELRNRISALQRSLKGPNRKEMTDRLREQIQALDARAVAFDAAARRVLAAFEHGRVGAFLAQLFRQDSATRLDALRELVRGWEAEPAILGSELNYVHGALNSPPLPAGKVLPAYADAATGPLSLDDGTAGREVELSPEIVAKAQQLGTTRAAWQFVLNEMRLDWYYGSLKGSTATLRERRGNDADLAALLVSLLRAQDTPARFVRGTISLSVEKLADLMGLLGATESGPVSAATADLILKAMSAAGIPFEPVQQGGRVSAVRFFHVWVEAYVPYSDYRGAGSSVEGRQWIPFEPAIPAARKYVATTPPVDALAEMNTTGSELTDAYLAQNGPESLVEFVQGRVQDFLATRHPELGYSQVLRVVDQRPESLPFLPGTLPYTVESVLDEAAFLPDDFHHQLRLAIADAAGTILSYAVPLHQVVGHRTILSFKPSTPLDEEIVAQSGGLYGSPAGVIQVSPVVRIDGVERAVGNRSVSLGASQRWTVELRLPGGARRVIQNDVIAGNIVAIGVGAPGISTDDAPPQPDDLDGDAPRFLFARAAAYENAWTESEEDLARLLRVVPVHPTADIVFVQNQLEVESVLGIPQRVSWKGLEIDADLRSMVPLELVPGRAAALMRLAGYEGSFLEAKVLSDGTGVAAVSAAIVVQNATALGVSVLRLTRTDQGGLAQIQASASVIADVQDQLARGREVIIPEAQLTLQDWTGTGYIVRDPATDEGGYFLSGRVSGGQTIVTPANWPPASAVVAPGDVPRAETDVTKAAGIVKVIGDLQGVGNSPAVKVGTVAPKKLIVKVLTSTGRPVEGVKVKFSRPTVNGVPVQGGALSTAKCGLAANRATLDAALKGDGPTVIGAVHAIPDVVEVVTDGYGSAGVWVTPDPTIFGNATLPKGRDDSFYGLDQIVAYAEIPLGPPPAGSKKIFPEQPFLLIGAPDKVNAVLPLASPNIPAVGGVVMNSMLGVSVQDRFGNALGAQLIHWTTDSQTARFVSPQVVQDIQRTDLYPRVLNPSDPFQLATVDQKTTSTGFVALSYIPGFASQRVEHVTASTGGASSVFNVSLVPIPGFTWAVTMNPNKIQNGVTGEPYPDEFVATIFRNTGSGWEPVRGDEPDLQYALVTMSATNLRSGQLLKQVTELPAFIDPTIPEDDSLHVFFRPTYLVDRAFQRLSFSAEVKTSNGVVCCGGSAFVDAAASTVLLSAVRVTSGLTEQPLNGGPGLTRDRALQLQVDHLADHQLYLRIRQPAMPILDIGGQGDFEHPTEDPTLVTVAPGSYVVAATGSLQPVGPRFQFPVRPDAQPGTVEFDVLPRPDQRSQPIGHLAVKYVAASCDPVIATLVLDRDDPAAQTFTELSGATVYRGTDASHTDQLKLVASVPAGNQLENVVWTLSGTGAGLYAPPATPEWNVGAIASDPGLLHFKVQTACEVGSGEASVDVVVGKRSDDIISVAWIDKNHVPLDVTGVHDDVLTYFPLAGFVGVPDSSRVQRVLTALYLLALGSGSTTRPGFDPQDPQAPALGSADAMYILNWLFRWAPNDCDKGKCPPDQSFADDAAVADFVRNHSTSYKLFNRFQIKYTVTNMMFELTPLSVKHATTSQEESSIGVTNDPIFNTEQHGAEGDLNRLTYYLPDSGSRINDGTPIEDAVNAFNTLAAVISADRGVPNVKWSHIGSRIEFRIDEAPHYRVYTQVYPTYFVFRNLRISDVRMQAPEPLDNFSVRPWPPGPAPYIP